MLHSHLYLMEKGAMPCQCDNSNRPSSWHELTFETIPISVHGP